MCNLAILSYRCGHKDSLLIHCPKGDPTQLCEPAEQTILARYQFDGNCLSCHTRWCTEQDNIRMALLKDEIDSLTAKKDDVSALDLELLMDTARNKATVRDSIALQKEDEMEGDIRICKEWAVTHATTIWKMLYNDTPAEQKRLEELQGARIHLITVLSCVL